MPFRVLHATDAYWRPSNQMGVLNTDLAKQLGTDALGARLWRLAPGQASTRHRHRTQTELYVLLEGTGRARVDDELLTPAPLSPLLIEPRTLRPLFNDTDPDALWRRSPRCSSSRAPCASSSTTPTVTRCGSSAGRRPRWATHCR